MTVKSRFTLYLSLLALAATSRASVILIDLGPTQAGTGIPDSNGISANTSLNTATMLDTDGNDTGIGIDISGWSGSTSNITASGPFTGDAAIFNSTANSLFQNKNTSSSATLTMTGLSATSTYDLVLFSSKFASGNRESMFFIAGGNSSPILILDAANNLSNVVTASGLTADVNNEINITVSPGPGSSENYYYFSAMQITETIPEPSSIALLGLGGLYVYLRRRRRR